MNQVGRVAVSNLGMHSGTVTFLFSDIEGSTRRWEVDREGMSLALALHDEVLRGAIEGNGGIVFKRVGDAFCGAFATAPDAVKAALDIQLGLMGQEWGEAGAIRVRIGLHTGIAVERDDDYFGPTVNRVARILAIGHGQQTLLSRATYELVRESLPAGASLADLGTHLLKDLAAREHVWQLQHPSLPDKFPPVNSLDFLATNLPLQPTSFIGRWKEMGEIKQALEATRLLTLTGSGGTGKTRLSLQTAADVSDEYGDGVWFVELASVTDPELVTQKVAEVLGIRETGGEPIVETLRRSLADKRMLLVLDNCEHVVATVAVLADAVLGGCPNVKILATSRETLGVAWEKTYRVPSMSLPSLQEQATADSVMEFESVRLFVERAEGTGSNFAVTAANAPVLARICRRLDGIPLAIELAAARVGSMTVEMIEARLDDLFRLLTGGSRTALPRQQTLRATVDWSYDLLEEPERAMLRRLSVFQGGWRLEEAEAVCSGDGIEQLDVLDLLTSLVGKSLVVCEFNEGTARYRLLETVRRYSADRLRESGEGQVVRTRHRDRFLALAEEAEPHFRGPDQAGWFERMDAELENLRAALEWSVSGADPRASLRLCGSLWRFWLMRGHLSEGLEWCVRALGQDASGKATRERADALNTAGDLVMYQGDYRSAQAFLGESLAIRREIGDRRGICASLNILGIVAVNEGRHDDGRAFYEESLAVRREIGDRLGIAATLCNLGGLALDQRDFVAARAFLEENLVVATEIGSRFSRSQAIGNLGLLAALEGDYVTARAHNHECLVIDHEMGHRQGVAEDLELFVSLAVKESRAELATVLWGAAEALRREIGCPLRSQDRERCDLDLAEARRVLGDDGFMSALERGRGMSVDQAVGLALTGPDV